MVCPFCLHTKTDIYNSRQTKKLNQVWRRRRCLDCGNVFTTSESIDLSSVIKIKNKGTAAPYKQGVLLASLLKACDHRADQASAAFYLLHICEESLQKSARNQTVTTAQVAQTVAQIIERFDTAAWAKYCSYHNLPIKKSRLVK